ncbi:Vacuolar import and degradation protein 27, partial [Colletotrichum sp. SAR11_239]
MLRFKDQPTLERFQDALLHVLWEQLNETKWEKIKERGNSRSSWDGLFAPFANLSPSPELSSEPSSSSLRFHYISTAAAKWTNTSTPQLRDVAESIMNNDRRHGI